MTDFGWIVIPKWEEFQHRDAARSKVPPWIKTWTRLLADDDFLDLSHHQRGVLLGIWLEYATATRQLRGSTSGLSRRLGQRVTTRDMKSLNDAGFITFSASKPASNIAAELPAQIETENETPPPPNASRKNGTNPRAQNTNPRDRTWPCPDCHYQGPTARALADHRELAHLPTNGNGHALDHPPDDDTLAPQEPDLERDWTHS